MKILTISLNAWNDTMATGNTFSNFFKDILPTDDIANIFCRNEKISNDICKKYYKVTESDIINSILKGHVCGSEFDIKPESMKPVKNAQKRIITNRIFGVLRNHRPSIFLFVREALWSLGLWKNKHLNQFLKDFAPDVIYMHGHNNLYMHKLLWYCQKQTGAKVAVFFGDDMYNYKGERFLKKIYHKLYRKQLENTINHADILFGGSPMLCDEYSSIFGRKFHLLIKSCNNIPEHKEKGTTFPLSLVYAGNLLYGRDKMLVNVAKALSKVNQNGIKAQLHIYTNSIIDNDILSIIDDSKNSIMKGVRPFKEICKILDTCDIAMYVESFENKFKKQTRLSFSTKIIDYYQSCSAILAYGPQDVSSIDYLVRSGVAIVATSEKDLLTILERIIQTPSIIKESINMKANYARTHHSKSILLNSLRNL